jgi:hypothetical protein
MVRKPSAPPPQTAQLTPTPMRARPFRRSDAVLTTLLRLTSNTSRMRRLGNYERDQHTQFRVPTASFTMTRSVISNLSPS